MLAEGCATSLAGYEGTTLGVEAPAKGIVETAGAATGMSALLCSRVCANSASLRVGDVVPLPSVTSVILKQRRDDDGGVVVAKTRSSMFHQLALGKGLERPKLK